MKRGWMRTDRRGEERWGWTAGALFLLALAVQLLAMVAVAKVRGSAAVYAYQSPDAGEYVALARGLALHGQYVLVREDGQVVGGPDTWRTPGFPAVLAVFIRVFGDSTRGLLLFQQIISALSVPLLWLILRRYTASKTWAMGLCIAWCVDPFRVYYSLWLLAEPLFVLVLLAGVWVYGAGGRGRGGRSPSGPSEGGPTTAAGAAGGDGESDLVSSGALRGRGGWTAGGGLVLGLLAGAAVLVRPIGILLPFLAAGGVAVPAVRRGCWRRLWPALMCAAGSVLVTGPWLLRNHAVAGHWALSHQSGASLAYHKVMDVLLWSEGRIAQRFDPAVQDEIRRRVDERLREEWASRFGPLTVGQREALSWRRLNYDGPVGVDPFVASDLLTVVGLDLLWEHRMATVSCFAAQGLSMLVFPLGLVLAPPAGAGAAPLSLLGGGGAASRIVAASIGSAYALLIVLAAWRLWTAMWERRWARHFFVMWPLAALAALTLPSEDPRFRLPLVPLLLILALPIRGKMQAQG